MDLFGFALRSTHSGKTRKLSGRARESDFRDGSFATLACVRHVRFYPIATVARTLQANGLDLSRNESNVVGDAALEGTALSS
jgi:hypothetical protein